MNKTIEFEGSIDWIHKKKNIPIDHDQMIKFTFDITDINTKRLPYRMEYIQELPTATCT